MKRKFLCLLVFSFYLLVSQPSPAQVRHLSLDSCTAWALEHQAAMKNALLDVEMARETRQAVFTKYFPTLSMNAATFRAANPLIDVSTANDADNVHITSHYQGVETDITEAVRQVLQYASVDAQLQMLQSGTLLSAMALQPIYAGGRIVNGNRLAELGVQAAELKLAMTTDEVELNTQEYYWRVVSLQAKVATLQQAMLLLDTLERDASAAVKAGVIGKNDLLKVRLKKNELQASDIQLRNGIQLATMALCQYVGIPYDEKADYCFDPVPILPQFSLLKSQVAISSDSRTEAQLLDLAVRAADLQKKMTLGESLPQLAVGASSFFQDFMGNGMQGNALFFATLSIPVTAWWETSHQVRKADLQRQQALEQRNDLVEQMALQNRQAWNEANEAYTQIAVRQQAVDLARENLAEVQHYYQAGLQGMSDLLEAQTLLTQAQNSLTDQYITYQLKLFRYRQLTRQ